MIDRNNITAIGEFIKPHGIKGEISAALDIDVADIDALHCIICDMEGIPVPFFISACRPKGSDTALLTIDGVGNETEAAQFAGKTIYALKSDIQLEEDTDGMYVSDMIGFTIVTDTGTTVGTITDIEDSTANILFIVATPSGNTTYIPAAEQLITNLDLHSKTIEMDLPEGLLPNPDNTEL